MALCGTCSRAGLCGTCDSVFARVKFLAPLAPKFWLAGCFRSLKFLVPLAPKFWLAGHFRSHKFLAPLAGRFRSRKYLYALAGLRKALAQMAFNLNVPVLDLNEPVLEDIGKLASFLASLLPCVLASLLFDQ